MKKFLLPLLTTLLFTACQKQISTDKTSEEIAGAAANKQTKFTVCHYDAATGISKSIEVTQNALAGHLAHGDLEGNCAGVLATICDQDWMVKNLDVTNYRNGDPIPQVTDPSAWAALTTGGWCYYNNDPANGTVYGKLYNWYAVTDPRGLAPTGWHVPSEAEWTTLISCLGGETIAGGALKEAGTTHWLNPNTDATNSSGFTGLPGGNRYYDGTFFNNINSYGFWWTTTAFWNGADGGWAHFLYTHNGFVQGGFNNTQFGNSVRCVRD